MQTITIKSPADLPHVIPQMLGFGPTDSAVMLTFGSPRPFHARCDLGPTQDMAEVLVTPALQHKVPAVILPLYGGNVADVRNLESEFVAAGINVVVACAITISGGMAKVRDGINEWDVILPADAPRTRDDLKAALQPQGERIPTITATYADNFWAGMTRETAKDWVDELSIALTAAPAGNPLTGEVAMMLAFASWVAGDGARSWIAINIALANEVQDDIGRLALLRIMLEGAVDPICWPKVQRQLSRP